MRLAALALIAAALAAGSPSQNAGRYFRIQVLDKQTHRGVPLIELSTVNNVAYVTDSGGLIAFDEQGMMDRPVFFFVKGHGYRVPADGFGYQGVRLTPRPGGRATVEVERVNVAERLYRITGEGIYRDTVLLGEKPPLRQPLINAGVLGQDSCQAVPFAGRLYWFWGDTNLPQYPLGVFQTTGATSALPSKGGLPASQGVDLTYFAGADRQARGICEREGPNPIWIDGLVAVPGRAGAERMVARYSRMKDLGTVLEHGLVVWDPKTERFAKHTRFDLADRVHCPAGQATRYRDGDRDYVLFATPFGTVRVRSDVDSLADQSAYEAFTCLAPGTKYARGSARVERDAAGRLVYAWKRGAEPVTQAQEREMIAAGLVRADEARFQVRDAETGDAVELHNGSLNWNAYRSRWVLIATQHGGKASFLGDIWYAEATSPTGPWSTARRIVTHDRYTFYNPVHHPFLDEQGGRVIYFEGTYCNSFSGNPAQTPRYDYNQVMYRLDLSDARLGQPRR